MKITDKNISGNCVELFPLEILEIEFNENPTTGYKWQITHLSKNVELVCDSYTCTDNRNPPAPGSGGIHNWQFRAMELGEGEIALISKRPWESTSPLQYEFRIKLNVVSKGK